ncbi:MAG: hypothetical protein PHW76_06920 [Alphaproteobacteria bacterium]|nr:hypothetical protein [Alphaproteobacteria bacterium]
MVDSIGSSALSIVPQRSLQTARLRSSDVLTAVQSQQESRDSPALKVFSVADVQKNGLNAKTKLPRGSLIDILA